MFLKYSSDHARRITTYTYNIHIYSHYTTMYTWYGEMWSIHFIFSTGDDPSDLCVLIRSLDCIRLFNIQKRRVPTIEVHTTDYCNVMIFHESILSSSSIIILPFVATINILFVVLIAITFAVSIIFFCRRDDRSSAVSRVSHSKFAFILHALARHTPYVKVISYNHPFPHKPFTIDL